MERLLRHHGGHGLRLPVHAATVGGKAIVRAGVGRPTEAGSLPHRASNFLPGSQRQPACDLVITDSKGLLPRMVRGGADAAHLPQILLVDLCLDEVGDAGEAFVLERTHQPGRNRSSQPGGSSG